MALTLPYPTLSNPITKAEIESNFSTLSNRFGSIGTADLSATAGIVAAQIAASDQEVWIRLSATNAWVAGTLYDFSTIPGSAADTVWTLTDVSWICTDVGDGAGAFRLLWGSYGAASVWATTTAFGPYTITATGGANQADQGRALEGGSTTLTNAAVPRSIALESQAAGVGVLSAGTLIVNVCLRRELV